MNWQTVCFETHAVMFAARFAVFFNVFYLFIYVCTVS